MTDIVDKLLDRAKSYRASGPSAEHTAALLEEAAVKLKFLMILHDDMADEIELLRAALREIEGMIPHAIPNYTHRVWTVARAALEGKHE